LRAARNQAALVRENWFVVSPGMARCYQRAIGRVKRKFLAGWPVWPAVVVGVVGLPDKGGGLAIAAFLVAIFKFGMFSQSY